MRLMGRFSVLKIGTAWASGARLLAFLLFSLLLYGQACHARTVSVTDAALCDGVAGAAPAVHRGVRRLRLQAQAGNVGAQLCLASRAYGRGQYDDAFRWFRRAAKSGDAIGEFNLGVLYARGLGVVRSERAAARWFRRSALQGVAYAQFNLAVMYERGIGVERDSVWAARWYQAAAEQGVARAQYNLGVLYHAGMGVRRDDGRAAHWLRLAAEQDVAAAQYDLAVLYESGSGVPRSPRTAVRWYRAAARQGLPAAQNNLGLLYRSGLGVRADAARAVYWFRRAAEQGNSEAQYNLGLLCVTTKPAVCTSVEGLAWLEVACGRHSSRRHTLELACRLQSAVEAELTAAQRRKAAALAGHWSIGQRLLNKQ